MGPYGQGPRHPEIMSRLKQLFLFLGLRQSIAAMLGAVIFIGMGERMAERFLPIYLIALGGGAISVGLLNAMDNLLSALYAFPGGYLADRIGTKRALLIFNLMAMAGFLVVVFIPKWEAVIGGAVLFLSWSAISQPATMSLVAKVLPQKKRTMGVSMYSLVRRIPMALGPLAGGALIDLLGNTTGVRAAFGVAFGMAAVALIIQQKMIKADSPGKFLSVLDKNPFRLLRRMHPDLKNLLVSDILVRFCEQIPYAFVVLWCMREIAAPVGAFQFGILTAVEMTTAVLVYIPVAYLADRAGKKPFVVMTFIFFTLFPPVLLFCRSFVWLIPAFALRGLKEFGEPTRKSLIVDFAPEDRRASTYGTYYLVRDAVVSVAAFGGAFLWMISPAANFLTASAFGLIGTVWFALRGRDLKNSHAKGPDLSG